MQNKAVACLLGPGAAASGYRPGFLIIVFISLLSQRSYGVPVTADLLGVKLQPALPLSYSHPRGKTGEAASVQNLQPPSNGPGGSPPFVVAVG